MMTRTVARALDILDLLAKTGKPMTQIEICQALDLPKSSAHDLMHTLLEREFIVYDNEQFKTFKLGLHVFEIGMTVIENRNMVAVARPYLVHLHNVVHETIFLAVENRNNIVYVDCAEERGIMGGYMNLGGTRPMYCSGLGKAILAAYNNPKKVKEIIASGPPMKVYTKNTITTTEALLKELELTRKRGYAIDNREVEPDTYCVAAPIYNRNGEPISAISVASVFTRMTPTKVKKCGELVKQTALEISRQMGYRKATIF
jgi:DNA-binding IclR family transcriptional regulator